MYTKGTFYLTITAMAHFTQ